MGLIICPECSKEISSKARSCPNCGYPMHLSDEDKKLCENCRKPNNFDNDFCCFCGKPMKQAMQSEYRSKSLLLNHASDSPVELDINSYRLNIDVPGDMSQAEKLMILQQQQLFKLQETQHKNTAKCPVCGSTSLTCNKQGFGIGKAVVGAVIAGPYGLLAGGIGANKQIVTCLNCGNKFKP